VPAETLPIESKAYAVYNALLREWVDGDKRATVSVVRFTHLGSTDCLDDVERSARWKSAVADLRRRNAATYTIEPRFDLPFRYELADTMERVGGILPPPPGNDPGEFLREGMARLDDMSKRHFTQVALSAPGISADGQLAIVYLSVSFAGAFHVLHKSGTKWIVRPDPKCRWISQHFPAALTGDRGVRG
jgi:hypothetical protein